MIQIDRAILSTDIITEKFVCDLNECKGICCIDGDSGAPLEQNELQILENIYNVVKEYLTPRGIEEIKKQGKYIIDSDGDYVTPLIDNAECAYTIFEKDGTAKCGIEKAWLEKKIDFQKPVSCHLYPIRITEYKDFDAVNYDVQDICKCARCHGEKLDVPVYEFLKTPLIRKYGEEWYKELEIAAEYIRNNPQG